MIVQCEQTLYLVGLKMYLTKYSECEFQNRMITLDCQFAGKAQPINLRDNQPENKQLINIHPTLPCILLF